jgi:hypothetical protein
MTNSSIHTGYDAQAKDRTNPEMGFSFEVCHLEATANTRHTSRDFAAVMAQTSELSAYLVFFPHIQSNRPRTIAVP